MVDLVGHNDKDRSYYGPELRGAAEPVQDVEGDPGSSCDDHPITSRVASSTSPEFRCVHYPRLPPRAPARDPD